MGYRIFGENIRTFGFAIFFMLIAVVVGTIGYMIIQPEYTVVDALYMTVITLSTVGFGEVHTLSNSGKLFTVFLIFISFGIFGYLASAITRFILDGVFRRNLREYRVLKKMKKLDKHVIVCGFGRNGRQACIELLKHGESVVVVDSSDAGIEKIRNYPDLLYIQGDATHDDVLDSANIKRAKALITAIPKDADNVYVVLTAREMNPDIKIISRSSNIQADHKLKRAGADNVIMPDRLGGQQMAKLVAQPDVIEFIDNILLQSTQGVNLVEVSCKNISDEFNGKSIKELNVRNRSGANIIGLKDAIGNYIYNPSAEIVLSRGFHLFVLGDNSQVENLKKFLLK
ncbi:MAG: potassium channel protein [Marinifilaceae bacterium]|jgi:voltage-gated potassium channel|nr:potassium channel protein [Marinifilaceae bacterium]